MKRLLDVFGNKTTDKGSYRHKMVHWPIEAKQREIGQSRWPSLKLQRLDKDGMVFLKKSENNFERSNQEDVLEWDRWIVPSVKMLNPSDEDALTPELLTSVPEHRPSIFFYTQ